MNPASQPNYRLLLQEALHEMRQMRTELEVLERTRTEPIAIIGMACRFPGGANTPDAYWQLLCDGVDAITEVPSDRWNLETYYDPNPEAAGKMYTRYGGFVDQVDQFDAQFFGISPREATSLDPQQRFLLEVSYSALEDAAQAPEQLWGSQTGVFIGIGFDDYARRNVSSGDPTRIDAYSSLGNTRSMAVGRLSYVLGLQGPTLQLDTTCSSSLLAVHLACQSLRTRESNLALAGGVNLMLSPEPTIGFCKLKALAPDGYCKTFDAKANGYVRGEGCGIVVLKRLSDALENGDRILAVIRGSAVNHDGQSNGLTAPNGTAQEAVIRQAIANAGVNPAQVQYVETHGTGTPLGDPIEVLALGKVLGAGRSPENPLLIGSVKTNIGHLESAAGVASLIKLILTLRHHQIPPHIHFNDPNPYIPWDKLPIAIPTELTPWNPEAGKRLAGVSSFGMSGTNVHVILEEAPEREGETARGETGEKGEGNLLMLSAKSETALQDLARSYAAFLSEHPDVSLKEICFTACVGRSHFEHRLAIVTESITQLHQQLHAFVEGIKAPGLISSSDQTLVDWTNSIESSADRQKLIQLAEQYVQGQAIDWQAITQGDRLRRISLPTYPFQHRRYWMEALPVEPLWKGLCHPLLGQKLNLAKVESIYFENQLSQHNLGYLKDHRLFEAAVMPGAGYLEMALAAGAEVLKTDSIQLTDVQIHRPLVLSGEHSTTIQLILTPQGMGEYEFEIFSSTQSEYDSGQIEELYASGRVAELEHDLPPKVDLAKVQADCSTEIAIASLYQSYRERGIEYGESFQAITKLWQGKEQAFGQLQLPEQVNPWSYHLHPIFLDASLQVIGAALPEAQTETYLPAGLKQFTVYDRFSEPAWSYVQLRSCNVADVQLITATGETIAVLEGVHLKPAKPELLMNRFSKWQDWLYQVEWQVQPRIIDSISSKHLLSPIAIRNHLWPQLSNLLTQPDLIAYAERLPQLESLSLAYIIQAFQQLNGTFYPGQHFSTAQLIGQFNIVPQQQRLFNRLLEILEEAGILQRQSDQWHVVQLPEDVSPEFQIQELLSHDVIVSGELVLLQRCGSQLAAVLQGQTDPLQLLFPNGNLADAMRLYQESPGSTLMNTLVQQIITLVSQHKPSGQFLRCLEIGAGTGGTTAYLLPHLKAATTEYVFTDVSPLFVGRARQTFKRYSFVRYQVLNIEQSPHAQGISQTYDIVIAANVLHATREIQEAIAHIQQLLAPGGLLVLLEGTQPTRWLDLIFGLTEGWWRFTDTALRSHYPLLSAHQWQQVLQKSGFEQVAVLEPELAHANGVAQQAVIVAQMPVSPISRTIENLGTDTPTQHWVLLSDQRVGAQLAEHLRANQAPCTTVVSGEAFVQLAENEFRINFDCAEDIQTLLKIILGQNHSLHRVIYLTGLDTPTTEAMNPKTLEHSSATICQNLLNLVKALAKSNLSNDFKLYLVTQGAVAVETSTETKPDVPGLVQSLLWGMGKTIALEHPELNCCCIDLDPNDAIENQIQTLLVEFTDHSPENQIALRQSDRYVARLTRYTVHSTESKFPSLATSQSFRLEIPKRGTLDQLQYQPIERRLPDANEVEIRVHAAGLNFRDVLNALNLYPGDPGLLGCECAGEIVAIGEAVQTFEIGDAVIAIAPGSFSQYVTVNAAMVVHQPVALSTFEAATIPVAFLTANYALHHLAKLAPGERVLIHAAAGGVGQAAIQLAQQAGAEVLATASPGKWEALRSLGVQHIMNSRTLDFVQEVLTLTEGQGVDVVLNSLSGEFIPKSRSLLKPQGRFIELGKAVSCQIEQSQTNSLYQGVDLVKLCQQQPNLIQTMLRDIAHQFAIGQLKPLPQTVFPYQDVVSAFRTMQQGKHIGKIVVAGFSDALHLDPPLPPWLKGGSENKVPLFKGDLGGSKTFNGSTDNSDTPKHSIQPNSTYLLTGGLGGLGLLFADWLVQHGAKHLILISRHSPRPAVQQTLQVLQQKGIEIRIAQADVARSEELLQVLTLLEEMPPLRGIIHAAGVLDDGLLLQQDGQQFARVLAPKVYGSWNLHCLTQHQPLDFFVLFSSATALLGSSGQVNHVAANTFLNALSHHRRSQGLPGLSINWGIWSEIGSAVTAVQTLQLKGISPITPLQGLQVFEQLLNESCDRSVAQVGVIPIDWSRVLHQGIIPPFLANFTQPLQLQESQPHFLKQLKLTPKSDRRSLLTSHLRSQIAQVLGFQPSEIDLDQGFFDLGMDSLTSVELKNRLQTSLGCSLPTTVAFDYPTVNRLVDYLIQDGLNLGFAGNQQAEASTALLEDSTELLPLSQAEIAELLAQELLEIEQSQQRGQR